MAEAPAAMTLEPASRYSHAELAAIFTAGYEGYFTPFVLDEAAFRFMSTTYDDDLDASRVALVDDEPAGICKLAIRGDRGWIGGVGVALPHRGKGIGEALMRAAIDEARSHGLRELWLEVLFPNEPALRLYEKLGFERVRVLEVWTLEAFDRGRQRAARRGRAGAGTHPARAEGARAMAARRRVRRAPGGRRGTRERPWRTALPALGRASLAAAGRCRRRRRRTRSAPEPPGRGHVRAVAERPRRRPVQRRVRVPRRHARLAPARDAAPARPLKGPAQRRSRPSNSWSRRRSRKRQPSSEEGSHDSWFEADVQRCSPLG